VYGLQPHALPGVPLAHTRIPDMATYHLTKVRSVQPHGPYLLGGMCAGAVIAFEMALQLQAQGERVALVALLDAADTQATLKPYREARQRLSRMAGEFERTQARPALRRAVSIARALGARLRNFVLYQIRRAWAGLRDALRLRLTRVCLDRRQLPPRLLGRLPVRTTYLFAARQYRPARPLHGELALFRATHGVGLDAPFIDFFSDPALGWNSRASGGVRVIDVPGGHTSMLQEPNVSVLADRLQEAVDRSLASGELAAVSPDVRAV
jgi:thioesterase domain-containing protein